MSFNPALNLSAFDVTTAAAAPPPINALYLRDGMYDGMQRTDVTDTFNAFRSQTATNRMAFFFHGGLVDKASGQRSAALQYDKYAGTAFPLFFIWQSGFGEVLSHHLPLIFAETIFGRVLFHAKAVLEPRFPDAVPPGMAAAAAVAAAPAADAVDTTADDMDRFMKAVQADPQVQNEAIAIARSSSGVEALFAPMAATGTITLSPRTLLSPDVVGAIRGAVAQSSRANLGGADSLAALPLNIGSGLQAAWAIAKAAVSIIVNVIRRFAAHRDHGLHCTIVEELLRALYLANFGSAVWEEMEKETEDAFGADSSKFGGTAVLEELCNLVQDRPGTVFTLVGHSAGAIYVGNFLRHADAALTARGDTTTQFDIVLMAPANTTDFFAQNYTKRIRGIRIFEMKDATEQQDHLISSSTGPSDTSILGNVYPRSLLYLVSGVCEYFRGQEGSGPHGLDGYDKPLLGMDRYFALSEIFSDADYPSLQQIRSQFPTPPTGRFARVLSPTDSTAPLGFRSKSEKHGNFPGDGPTMESIQTILQSGL